MEIHALSGVQTRLQYVRDSRIAIFRAVNAAMGPIGLSIIRSLGPSWNLDQTAKFTQNINTESCLEAFSVFLEIKCNYTSTVPFYVNGYLTSDQAHAHVKASAAHVQPLAHECFPSPCIRYLNLRTFY
jgi:hypothetical protein